MNTLERAQTEIEADNSEKKGSEKKTRRQILIHVASILMIVVLLVFVVVLGKAFFDGEFSSVESLQKYIEKYGKAVIEK